MKSFGRGFLITFVGRRFSARKATVSRHFAAFLEFFRRGKGLGRSPGSGLFSGPLFSDVFFRHPSRFLCYGPVDDSISE